MPIVALKCPYCGGEIELDDAREYGFCMYCGQKVFVAKEKVDSIRIDRGPESDGLISYALNMAEIGKKEESAVAIDRAMILSPDSLRVWIAYAALGMGNRFPSSLNGKRFRPEDGEFIKRLLTVKPASMDLISEYADKELIENIMGRAAVPDVKPKADRYTRIDSIAERQFSGRIDLKAVSVDFPVENIPYQAFSDCRNLTAVKMSISVRDIGNRAFYGCSSLKTVEFSEDLMTIGAGAFGGCRSLTEIVIPYGVTAIGSAAFMECSSLKTVHIPDSVRSIGAMCFHQCRSLENVSLPESLKKQARDAFDGRIGF